MRKFFTLLKKEIKELTTLEMLLPLVFVIVLFGAVGNIMGKEQEKAKEIKQDVIVIDNDKTPTSQIIEDTVATTLNVEEKSGSDINTIANEARKENKSLLLVLPEGFEQSVKELNPNEIEVYSIIRNFSMMGAKNYQIISASLTAINEAISNELIKQNTDLDPAKLKKPMITKDYVMIGERKAETNPMEVMTHISNQTTFIPIILFMVIIMAAQMIATAIASEKENKTLETLLTAPVKRTHIVIAKMAAAGIVALASSAVYLYGFRNYMDGIAGDQLSISSGKVADAVNQLGLSFSPSNYILLGLALFFGILAALSIALILGAFAQDVKSVAGLTTPLMILVGIPYFLTLFLDINSLSPALRYAIYAIPFSHSFLAAPNILLNNYTPIIWGIIYQFAFFAVFVLIAAKIFSTDKIVTMKLNFNKKKLINN